MIVQFNRPITILGTTYGKGTHHVPPEAKSVWCFDALVAEGAMVIVKDDEPATEHKSEPAPAPAQAQRRRGRRPKP